MEHESFGVIRVSRVSGNAALFQSPHTHQHFINVEVHHATHSRDLSHDNVYPTGRPLVSVYLSEAQWSTFVSSINMGSGVPCTVNMKRDGQVRFCEPPPETKSDAEIFVSEFKERIDSVSKDLSGLIAELSQRTSSSMRPMNKGELNDLLGRLKNVLANCGPNLGFVAKSFEEQVARRIAAAKSEVEAHALNLIMRKGLGNDDRLEQASEVQRLPSNTGQESSTSISE